MSFNKILVAINNSSLSPQVFAAALEQSQLNQAALKLLYCKEKIAEATVPMPFDPGLKPSLTMSDYQNQRLLIEEQIEEGQALLEQYRQAALNQGVSLETDCQVGETGHLVCEAAKEWEADLVVIGRRGRSGLAKAFLGSVSNYVVHNAPCAVLVIRELESETPEKAISNLASVQTNPAATDQTK